MPKSNSRIQKDRSDWGVMEMARERPIAAVAVAAGAAATGLFLWSRRNEISQQINSLGDQIGEWTDSIASSSTSSSRTSDTVRRANMRSGASRSTSGTRTSGTRKRGGITSRARGTRKTGGSSASLDQGTNGQASSNN